LELTIFKIYHAEVLLGIGFVPSTRYEGRGTRYEVRNTSYEVRGTKYEVRNTSHEEHTALIQQRSGQRDHQEQGTVSIVDEF